MGKFWKVFTFSTCVASAIGTVTTAAELVVNKYKKNFGKKEPKSK